MLHKVHPLVVVDNLTADGIVLRAKMMVLPFSGVPLSQPLPIALIYVLGEGDHLNSYHVTLF